MSDRKVLNLDELFGAARPILVKRDEKVYELKSPDAFGPQDVQRLEKLQRRFQELQKAGAGERDLTDAEDQELRQIAGEELRLLCPSLLRLKLPFMQQMAILGFYFAELEDRRKAQEAKKAETASPLTGETSTPA